MKTRPPYQPAVSRLTAEYYSIGIHYAVQLHPLASQLSILTNNKPQLEGNKEWDIIENQLDVIKNNKKGFFDVKLQPLL
jgi:hypothetical protein